MAAANRLAGYNISAFTIGGFNALGSLMNFTLKENKSLIKMTAMADSFDTYFTDHYGWSAEADLLVDTASGTPANFHTAYASGAGIAIVFTPWSGGTSWTGTAHITDYSITGGDGSPQMLRLSLTGHGAVTAT